MNKIIISLILAFVAVLTVTIMLIIFFIQRRRAKKTALLLYTRALEEVHTLNEEKAEPDNYLV